MGTRNKSNKAAFDEVLDKVLRLARERPPRRYPDSSLSPEAREAIQALRDERRLTREKLDRAATI